MKRLLAICVCFFMCVGLCSCDSSQTRSVSSYNWSLEFITDLDGNMLFSGSVHDDIPVLDLTLSFEEKSFILTDNTHKQEWTGTYSLEKIDNSSSKLGLTFENLEEPVTGVYGTRVYSDDSESATITLQTDRKYPVFCWRRFINKNSRCRNKILQRLFLFPRPAPEVHTRLFYQRGFLEQLFQKASFLL